MSHRGPSNYCNTSVTCHPELNLGFRKKEKYTFNSTESQTKDKLSITENGSSMKRRMVLHLQREPICDAVRDCTEGNTQAGANIAIEFYLVLSCVCQSSV